MEPNCSRRLPSKDILAPARSRVKTPPRKIHHFCHNFLNIRQSCCGGLVAFPMNFTPVAARGDYSNVHDQTHGLLTRDSCPAGMPFVLVKGADKQGLRLRMARASGKLWQLETRMKGKLITRALSERPVVSIAPSRPAAPSSERPATRISIAMHKLVAHPRGTARARPSQDRCIRRPDAAAGRIRPSE